MGERPQRNHRNPARHNDFINWRVLEELDENYQSEHEALSNANEEAEEEENLDEQNPIFEAIRLRENGFYLRTNFTKSEISTIFYEMQSTIARMAGTRGPKPAISPLDSLLLILMMYKHGWEYVTLGFSVRKPKSTVKSAVERILPILHASLRTTWWSRRVRPCGTWLRTTLYSRNNLA